MLNEFSGDKTPGVVWKIILCLRIDIIKKRQPAQYTVFNNVGGIVYRDCTVRSSDLFLVGLFVCFCVGVLVIRVLVFTVFFIVCTAVLCCFFYVYLFLFVLSVLV
jgi:hypothetical protein